MTGITEKATKPLLSYIAFLQLIGPIFVVLGHSLNGFDVHSGWWYVCTKEWIYLFHMPLFFMISGYLLLFNPKYRISGCQDYFCFLLKKSRRLLLPYVVWNLVFLLPKMFFQPLLTDQAPKDVWQTVRLFFFPRQNILGHTWFLLALFLLYVCLPLWQWLFSQPRAVWYLALGAGVVLYMLPIKTECLALSDLHRDLLFFLMGGVLARTWDHAASFARAWKRWWVWLGIISVVTSVMSLVWYDHRQMQIFFWIPCTAILLCFLSIGTTIDVLPKVVVSLASCSFGIYIMHWPIMLAVRLICVNGLGMGVGGSVACMILCGWGLPVILLYLLRRIGFVQRHVLFRDLLGV